MWDRARRPLQSLQQAASAGQRQPGRWRDYEQATERYATKLEQAGEAPADARLRATQELRLLRATRRPGGSALRGAVLPDQPARPGLGDSEALPELDDHQLVPWRTHIDMTAHSGQYCERPDSGM